MANDYTFLGAISLDAGSWADWFSGSMSLAAVGAAFFGYWNVHKQRVTDELERQKRAAESLGWKALNILNDTATIAKHLREQLEGDVDLQFKPYKFVRVRPLGIPSRSIAELNQEEIALLLRAEATTVLMELGDAIGRYESIRFAMEQYKAKHEALFDLMPSPVAVNGALFTHKLSRDEYEKVMPYAEMLEVLLDGIIDLVASNVEAASKIIVDYGAAMTAHFGKWHLVFDGDLESADLTIFRTSPIGTRGMS